MTGPRTRAARDIAEDFVGALHGLDANADGAVERMLDLFTDDALLTNATLRRAGTERRGRDELRQFWSEYARTFPQARTEFRAVTIGEGAVGLFWTTHGRDAQGEPVHYDGASLLLLDGVGRITTFSGYFDPDDLKLAPLPVRSERAAPRPEAGH